MQHLQLTMTTPAENLALDEALLDAAEAGLGDDVGSLGSNFASTGGVLRIWEPKDYFVVLGRSSNPQQEVNLPACQADKVPILRRSSGGATIVAGPGCLMVAVVLGYEDHPTLRAIDAAHRFVLGRMATALANFKPSNLTPGNLALGIRQAGTSDLIVDGNAVRGNAVGGNAEEEKTSPAESSAPAKVVPLKFSGNSMRCKQSHFLYHGTLLYDFDLERISRWLNMPARQPDYRRGRQHNRFLTNLPATREELEHALIAGWQAEEPLAGWPGERTARLVRDKYSLDKWTWMKKE